MTKSEIKLKLIEERILNKAEKNRFFREELGEQAEAQDYAPAWQKHCSDKLFRAEYSAVMKILTRVYKRRYRIEVRKEFGVWPFRWVKRRRDKRMAKAAARAAAAQTVPEVTAMTATSPPPPVSEAAPPPVKAADVIIISDAPASTAGESNATPED